MKKLLKNKIKYLIIGFNLAFISCATQINENKDKRTIVSIKKVYIEDGNKDIQTLIGVFSIKKDTIVVYRMENDNFSDIAYEYLYYSKKGDKNSRFFLSQEFKDSTKVSFLTGNKILVNKDTYKVNTEYYSFLNHKIIEEGSILDFIALIKDGYGDYVNLYEPLINNKWSNSTENGKHKIINVEVNNINNQTNEEEVYTWKVIYNDKNVIGERYKKSFLKENIKYKIYSTEKNNERSEINKIIYKNKKTSLDSIVGNWVLNSNNINHNFISYQTELKIKKTNIKNKKNKIFFINK